MRSSFFDIFFTGARTYRTYDAAFMALCSNMQQQVLDCKRKADYMTLVRRVLRQSRTLPLPLGMPTDLRQARKDLVRESGVFLNDNLHRMGDDNCVSSFERKLFASMNHVMGGALDNGQLQGIVHSIIVGLSRTVLGGDAYGRCNELFNNPNMVVLTSESQLAPPLRIEIMPGKTKSVRDTTTIKNEAIKKEMTKDMTKEMKKEESDSTTSTTSTAMENDISASEYQEANAPDEFVIQEGVRVFDSNGKTDNNDVDILGTIRIESVDVIKISHFDIENLLDEPEIWLLLRAEVVQSFEIVRVKGIFPPPPPTTRTARNINITSLRTNILSLADFGLIGVNESDRNNNRALRRRKKQRSRHKTGSGTVNVPGKGHDRSVTEDFTSPKLDALTKKKVTTPLDINSCTVGPLNTSSIVSL